MCILTSLFNWQDTNKCYDMQVEEELILEEDLTKITNLIYETLEE